MNLVQGKWTGRCNVHMFECETGSFSWGKGGQPGADDLDPGEKASVHKLTCKAFVDLCEREGEAGVEKGP